MSKSPRKQVALIGCGGNVGGFCVDFLGRLEEVGRVWLCDPQLYEKKNLRTQNILRRDVGHRKAIVQAERLKQINPNIEVDSCIDSIEAVPLGLLSDVDIILSAVDSRRARQVINEIARRLDVPLLDCGVDGHKLIARVSVYFPGRDDCCAECRWGAEQYRNIETIYPCAPDVGAPAATNSTAQLGALAASLMVIECQKVLNGATRYDGSGYEVLMEADYHNLYPARLNYNPECRLPEHRSGSIKPPDGFETRSINTTLGELLRGESAGEQPGCSKSGRTGGSTDSGKETADDHRPTVPSDRAMRLQVVGNRFVTHLTCGECGHRRAYVKLRASLKNDGTYKCDRCGGEMFAAGFDTLDELDSTRLSAPTASRSLRSVGIRDGDVIRLRRSGSEPRYVVTLNGTQTARTKRSSERRPR
ncbi:MAG: ThiF family adenylyltransferase [Candidatus Latescibacterota bacterium]|nr:MAG: ThiF family adenylyltransferase [Candidatus Latescibacterota bacterium]